MFPQKILGYQDFLQYEFKILEEDFDFSIMPGWTANDLLRGKVVDTFFKVGSIKEMNRSVIQS